MVGAAPQKRLPQACHSCPKEPNHRHGSRQPPGLESYRFEGCGPRGNFSAPGGREIGRATPRDRAPRARPASLPLGSAGSSSGQHSPRTDANQSSSSVVRTRLSSRSPTSPRQTPTRCNDHARSTVRLRDEALAADERARGVISCLSCVGQSARSAAPAQKTDSSCSEAWSSKPYEGMARRCAPFSSAPHSSPSRRSAPLPKAKRSSGSSASLTGLRAVACHWPRQR